VTDFRDLVDPDDLSPDEELRLRRVHELLVQAGPPPDLPPALLEPPTRQPVSDVAEFPLRSRGRRPVIALIAAALASTAGSSRRSSPASRSRARSCSAPRGLMWNGVPTGMRQTKRIGRVGRSS